MSDMEEIIEAAHEAWVNDPDANPHFVDDSEQSLTQAIAQALTQAGYGKAVVRELEWKERASQSGQSGTFYHARTVLGSYSIHHRKSGAVFVSQNHAGGWAHKRFPDLEAAKAACQADHDTRVRGELVEAPASGGQWQTIETAPKDGTEILVCVTHNVPGVDGDTRPPADTNGYVWETTMWVDWQLPPHFWPNYQASISVPFPPTHWMPLPQPPEEE